MEWFILVVVGVGFTALIVWVNFYALDDDSPNPGEEGFVSGPDVTPADANPPAETAPVEPSPAETPDG